MSFKVIESRENKTFKDLLKLKKGDAKEGLFIVEGKDLVDEAKKAGLIKALIVVDGTK
jgi:tRNA G18 (ribose-2'-O)-methylase SpoU